MICADCGQEKEYYAKGLCKVCYNRRWKKATPKKVIAHVLHWQAKNREKCLAYKRRWRERNPHKQKALQSRWNREHPEAVAAKQRRYRQRHPEKIRAKNARRRARKQEVANTLTEEQGHFELNVAQAMYPDDKLHLHHLVPLSKGGGHTWGNIMFLPASLNLRIGNSLPEEIYEQMSF